MSTGSGVMHAEGGANDIGDVVQGFQIWINVPAENKLDDPADGTVPYLLKIYLLCESAMAYKLVS